MRRKLVAVLMALWLIVMPAAPVIAATTADIIIRATGDFPVLDPPTGLILTRVTDVSFNATWTPPAAANGTILVMLRDRYPATPTDGTLLYSGNLTAANFTGYDLDMYTLCVSAFSYNVSGLSREAAHANIGGELMLLLIIALVAIGCMLAAFFFKMAVLAMAAMPFWALFGFQCLSLSAHNITGEWDVYYGLFFVSVLGMVLLCIAEAVVVRPKKQDAKDDVYVDDIDKVEKEMDDLWRQTRIPRVGRNRRER